jgi:hypothetical protein
MVETRSDGQSSEWVQPGRHRLLQQPHQRAARQRHSANSNAPTIYRLKNLIYKIIFFASKLLKNIFITFFVFLIIKLD